MGALATRMCRGWKELGTFIADFQARLLLTVLYFTVLVPFGLLIRLLYDPLHRHGHSATSNWIRREAEIKDVEQARRQF